jgi:hypothetical protein
LHRFLNLRRTLRKVPSKLKAKTARKFRQVLECRFAPLSNVPRRPTPSQS